MSTDWNQKLFWVLRDLSHAQTDLLALSGYRSDLLDSADTQLEVGPRGDWLLHAADRVPFPTGSAGARIQLDWPAHPEVTHPIAKARHTCAPIDLEATHKVLGTLLSQSAKRFEKDSRRILLWMWRYLAEELAGASEGPGAIATQIPADPRLPNLSVWQRIAFDTALAGASPSPTFLAVQICPPDDALDESATLQDLYNSSSIAAQLIWSAMLPIIDALGPQAIIAPSLLRHPRVDAWLADQKVTSTSTASSTASSSVSDALPDMFVALVPSDRASELGQACQQSFEQAWAQMSEKVRDRLVKDGWVKAGDEAWASLWMRQTSRAWQVHWTAVAWSEDSTGAGSLLSKQEVMLLEKFARLSEDAFGLEDPWPGIFYGLWFHATLAAASARQQMGTTSILCEPDRPCTACGRREALHDGAIDTDMGTIRKFWKPIPKKTKGLVQENEILCAVCTMRRLGNLAGLTSTPPDLGQRIALVVFGVDQPSALLRGSKDLKQAASLGDNVHSSLEKSFTKRTRSHVKEILDNPSHLGPARQMAIHEIFADFLATDVPSVLDEFGAFLIEAANQELTIAAPVDKAYSLVKALREKHQQSFVELESPSGKRLALRLGPEATTSAILAIVSRSEGMGTLLQDCRSLLDELARTCLGGDALVLLGHPAEEQLYVSRWDDLGSSLGVLADMLPTIEFARVLEALRPIVPALSNMDLDKAVTGARASLAASVLQDVGLGQEKAEALASALCQMIDQGARLPAGVEENHALDGLHLVASLCGVDQ